MKVCKQEESVMEGVGVNYPLNPVSHVSMYHQLKKVDPPVSHLLMTYFLVSFLDQRTWAALEQVAHGGDATTGRRGENGCTLIRRCRERQKAVMKWVQGSVSLKDSNRRLDA